MSEKKKTNPAPAGQEKKTRKLVTMGMLTALAYLMVVLIRIPVVMFLSYEPKDIAIVIAGFIYGPLESFLISLVVSLLEMVTISSTGWIGAVMNLVSSCAFACTAAAIYKHKHTLKGAIIGLLCGVAAMVAVMLLWNYWLTPIYMGYPREAVAAMLPTVFLPFNLLKGGLNAAITMLLYKPLVRGLRKARLIPASRNPVDKPGYLNAGVIVVVVILLIICIFCIARGFGT